MSVAGVAHPLPVQFYRIRVTSDCFGSVEGCRAALTKIEFNGEQLWGDDSVDLTFAPGEAENSTVRTIEDKMEVWIDVFVFRSDGGICVGSRGRLWQFSLQPLERILGTIGTYDITVVISSKVTRSIKAHLEFTRNQQWNQCALTLKSTE